MKIEINPRSLLNLENICEVLYKLHPSVLNYLVDMERTLGSILGFNDMDNLSIEQREIFGTLKISNIEDQLPKLDKDDKDFLLPENDKGKLYDLECFNKLYKYLQLDTYEYIPIKIYIEVEDPVIGKKVRELVRALEKTGAPEQIYLNKRELDYHAYFAEGYNIISMNEEKKKKKDDLFSNDDVEGLKKILIKEKLYP